MMRWMAVVAMVVALGGCYASQSPEVTLTCRAGKDCEIAWGKAWKWVESASYRPIIRVDNYRIMTTRPKDGDSAEIAYEITKRAVSNTTYEIVFYAYCSNPLGCGDDPELKAKRYLDYMTR